MFDVGGPQFGLNDCKIAAWNSAGSYGTAGTVPSVQVLGARTETVKAELEGNDMITAVAAIIVKGVVTLRMGSVHLDVLAILTGKTVASSGSSPQYRRLKVTNKTFPYIGICGRANSVEAVGDTHLWIPKCKVVDGFEVKFEYGQFSIPEITLQAVPDSFYADGSDNTLYELLPHNAVTPVVIPPVYAN